MSFWDSQILGVTVGAVIGGLGKVIYDIRTANQLCMSLERGIKAEAKVIRGSIKSGYDSLSGYLDAIKSGGKPTRKYRSLLEFRMSFTEANLEKIGMLDREFLEPLIEVRAMLEVLPEALRIMWNTQDEFIDDNEGKRKLLVDQLKSAVATFKSICENCDRLLKHESNYSTIDTLIRYIRNTIEKIIKWKIFGGKS